MAKQKVYVVTEDGYTHLSFDGDFYDNRRLATNADLTLKAMAQLLDDDAEGSNHHDFVGLHADLGKLIAKETDTETATRIMRKIVDRGGLQSMA